MRGLQAPAGWRLWMASMVHAHRQEQSRPHAQDISRQSLHAANMHSRMGAIYMHKTLELRS